MTNHRGRRFLIAVVATLAAVSSPIVQSSREAVAPGERWETAFRALPVPTG